MNRALLTLVILISAASLYGMEKEMRVMENEIQSSPITLSQLYYHFSHDLGLLPEITQHIFSFQCGDVTPAKVLDELKQSSKNPERFVRCIETLITSCGELIASEICECFFVREKISVGDIQDHRKNTCLHVCANLKVAQILLKIAGINVWKFITVQGLRYFSALHMAVLSNRVKIVELFLNAAGDNAYKLLTMKDDAGSTALHWTVFMSHNNSTEIAKLLLNAADKNAPDLIMIKNIHGITAFDKANKIKPEIKEIMQKYMENNELRDSKSENNTQICCIQ